MADRKKSEEQLPDELNEFERALRSLKPGPEQVDRCRLMYLAGRASAEASSAGDKTTLKRNWAWPVSTAAMTLVAASLAFALVFRPPPERETIYVERPTLAPSSEALVHDAPRPEPSESERPSVAAGWDYSGMKMRRAILDEGADALPNAGMCSIDSPSTSREMLDELLWEDSPGKPTDGARPSRPGFDWKSILLRGEKL